MSLKNHLYILWTNADPVSAEKMVFMYGVNARRRKWWDEVTIIIWGAPARLVVENGDLQKNIAEALEAGVNLSACKACADQLGATGKLLELGVEVKFWGQPLTELLKSDAKILTV